LAGHASPSDAAGAASDSERIPDATMETRMESAKVSSNVAPTMMFASASTSWRTRLAASSTS